MISPRLQYIAMLLLAIYPVINFYYNPAVPFGYGTILFVIYILNAAFQCGLKNIFMVPRYFVFFWMYAGFITFITAKSFNPTFLLPGGTHVFLWVLCMGVCCKFVNIEYLRNNLRFIVVLSTILFIIQFVMITTMGSKICFVPPLSQNLLYREFDYSDLMLIHMTGDRASSIFMEPAYFAQYLLVLLTLELFHYTANKRIQNFFVVLIVIVLLLLRSGSGIVGMAILAFIKFSSILSNLTFGKRFLFMIFIIPVLIFGFNSYTSSDVGSQIVERQSELSINNTESSGFVRVLGGFLVYDNLSAANKIFGSNNDDVKHIAQTTLGYEDGMLFNGVQAFLVSFGLIGTILLVIAYLRMYKTGSLCSKSSVICLLIISLFEFTYFTPLMLMLTVIAFGSQREYASNNQNK